MVKKSEVSRLSRQDWINAGLSVLGDKGVEAVRVEPLAKRLSVTKGSFYWHFKNRGELLHALLEHWVNSETDSIIEQVEAMGGNTDEKLRHLFELAIRDNGRVENAIRAWAARDTHVAAVLSLVDQRRLDYTTALFVGIGFTPQDALVRARLIYYALVGEFSLGVSADLAERVAEMRLRYRILTQRL